MWKLIEQAETLQNNIIRAEIGMRKLKHQNSLNFTEQNEFMEVSLSRQLNKDIEEHIEIQFDGILVKVPKDQTWENIKSRIQDQCDRKMSYQGMNKIKNILGLPSEPRNEEKITEIALQTLEEPQNIQKIQAKPILVASKKTQKVNSNLKTQKIGSKGKENVVRKSAYMDIHQRKKQSPMIR